MSGGYTIYGMLFGPPLRGSCHNFFGPRPVFRPDQKVQPILVLGQRSAAHFFPTHPVLVRPGLVVAVTGYPRVICMRAHWIL